MRFGLVPAKRLDPHLSKQVSSDEQPLVAITEALEETSLLAQREHYRTKMYGMMVHKLKSPLTAIYGFTESLQARLPSLSYEQIAQKLDKILDNVREMTRLIEMDLDCIRNEFIGWETNCCEVDVNFVLLSLVEDLRMFYRNLEMTAPLLTRPTINADTKILAITIQHLVENAWKHGDREQPIVVETTELPHTVGISVTSWNKEGDYRELSESLFQPFTGKNTGLGLYIVKQYTESMGGVLRVSQTEDRRSNTFTLWLQKETSSDPTTGEVRAKESVSS